LDNLPFTLSEVAKASYIPKSDCSCAIVLGWGQAPDHVLDDSLLSESEHERLLAFAYQQGLTYEDLNVNGAFDRAEKAKIPTELSEGRIPTQDIKSELPFNLKKSEEVVYLFG
jgi:hypothetical protein